MLEKEVRTLHRENYASLVKENEKHLVHYKVENVLNDSKTNRRISQQILCMTDPVQFESVKRNLELQGNTVEIIYHPQGKYNNVRIEDTAEMLKESNRKIIEAKDAEIAELRQKIEAMSKEPKVAKEPKAVKETKKK